LPTRRYSIILRAENTSSVRALKRGHYRWYAEISIPWHDLKWKPTTLADKGDSLPCFRREMLILNKVLRQPGIAMNDILDKFSKEEINDIYPVLGSISSRCWPGNWSLWGYVDVKDNKVTITDKGKKKLESFKASLTAEEREALKI
jgi:hypothetical protein